MQAFINDLGGFIKEHAASHQPMSIRGGNTKAFYGGEVLGESIDMRPYNGIIEYEAKELVLVVRAGTTLAEIEAAMDTENQMLPFEPPRYKVHDEQVASLPTIGGTVATGLSGPRRAYTGAVRDFVLGTRIMNGQGECLNFGGRVIKNVAGYDVSRLMTGAMGTLGVLLDVAFKVLPKPASEMTLKFDMDEVTAIQSMNEWASKPLPLSATCWVENCLLVRLSGAESGVKAAREKLGGELLEDKAGRRFWAGCRDQTDSFFSSKKDEPLWRLSVPATTPPLQLGLPNFIEWGGALRWIYGAVDAKTLRAKVGAIGGHVTLFRGGDKSVGVFHPLQPVLVPIHRNLKSTFDPANILNRGRMDNF